MKARKGYIQQKGQYGVGKWLKRYFNKRTCRRKHSLSWDDYTQLYIDNADRKLNRDCLMAYRGHLEND